MTRFLLALVMVFAPALASAQAITAYNAAITQGTAVVASATLPIAQWACNQPMPPPGASTVNPQRIVVADPVNIGRACIWTDPGVANPATPGLLLSQPFNAASDTLTLAAVNLAGTSGVSTPSLPFSFPGAVPPAPGQPLVIK